jgi:hypothetical protein
LTGEINRGTTATSIQVGNRGVTVYHASGAIEYAYMYPNPTVEPKLPSPEEGEAIATDIVSRLGLIPEGIEATYQGYGEIGRWPLTLLIGFKRTLDGRYFAGAGAKYEVRIGDNGELTRLFINPIRYTPEEMVDLKPVGQAFEEMKAGKRYNAPADAQSVVIESVTIVYWLESVTHGQDYIVPMYCFTGKCFNFWGIPITGGFTAWVEALK